MALIDDYNQAVENPQFRQKVAIQVARSVMSVLGGTPTAPQLALGKRFLLSPAAEVDRYLLPVAARIMINAGSFTNDAHISTAVTEVLSVNVTAGIA